MKWAPQYSAKWLRGRRKMQLMIASVLASVPSASKLCVMTTATNSVLHSWRRSDGEFCDGDPTRVWWRRMHRAGHAALVLHGLSLSKLGSTFIHRCGGHAARLPDDRWLASVMRVRAVQRWRWRPCQKDKWSGVRIIRWEDQLCRRHGDGCAEHSRDNSGAVSAERSM